MIGKEWLSDVERKSRKDSDQPISCSVPFPRVVGAGRVRHMGMSKRRGELGKRMGGKSAGGVPCITQVSDSKARLRRYEQGTGQTGSKPLAGRPSLNHRWAG